MRLRRGIFGHIGMITDWSGLIITAYVGGRSIEKVARIFVRRS